MSVTENATSGWERIEGMIIVPELDPVVVAEYLKNSGVLACLEWYAQTPHLLSITVSASDNRVGILTQDTPVLKPGLTLGELTEAVAKEFNADVWIGDIEVDHLAEGVQLPPIPEPDELEEFTYAAEISPIPAASVPLLAAFENTPIAVLELSNDRRVLLTAVPADHTASPFLGDMPLVQLNVIGDEFRASLITSSDPESPVLEYTWGMKQILVMGSVESPSKQLRDYSASLVGRVSDLRAIAEAVPGASASELIASGELEGEAGLRAAVRALSLPSSVADMLLGKTNMNDIPGVVVHESRGLSNAIGRSVDMLMAESVSSGQGLWDAYHKVAIEKPWIIRIAASTEAVLGTVILVMAVRAKGSKTVLRTLRGMLGGFMIMDSVAEVSLAKYLALRAERHREYLNQIGR